MSFEQRLKNASSRLERKLLLMGELTRRLQSSGIVPIVVGGTALEVYTVGDYLTADLDIVVPARDALIRELEAMNFQREGRLWYHPEWELLVEIPDEQLAGAPERIIKIEVDSYTVACIGLEDLIIDRLNAGVHWRSQEDMRWVETLLHAYREQLDLSYLRQRAQEEETLEALDRLLKGFNDETTELGDP